MDFTENLVILLSGQKLSTPVKVFMGVQAAVAVFVMIFLIILVWFPTTYNLNAAGVWMSRIALGGLVLGYAMVKFGGKLAAEVKAAKEAAAALAKAKETGEASAP